MNPRSNLQQQLAELHASRHPDRVARDITITKLHSMYVTTERDERLENAINELISVNARHTQAMIDTDGHLVGRLAEGRTAWLLGESGAGKTRSLERIFGRIPQFANYRTDRGATPLVSVIVPSPFTLRQFAQDLASACGYETNAEMRENQAWSLARQLIQDRVSFIHIDEAHNFLENNNRVELTKARNALRGLVQRSSWPVCLILSGRPHAELLAADFQLFRRRIVVRFGSIVFERDRAILRGAFVTFCERSKLRHGEILNDDGILERLCYASEHQLGVAFELMQDAISHAIDQKRTIIAVDDLAFAYKQRAGGLDADNIMTMAEGWRGVTSRPNTDSHLPIGGRNEHSRWSKGQ